MERFAWKAVTTLMALCVVMTARADLPLTVEDLLTAKGRYRIEADLVFANSNRRQTTSALQTIQAGGGQFIQLPVSLGDTRHNADVFATTLGFRYGLSLETELYTRLTGTSSTVRSDNASGASTESAHAVNDWTVGINHRFSDDNDTPALLAFIQAALAENTRKEGADYVHGKTWQIGFTTYRTIDPLVLSLTGGYRRAGNRETEGVHLDPGDLLWLNPSVGFAVNTEVTLTGGLQLRWKGKDRSDGNAVGTDTSQTRLELGLGYAASKRLTLRLNTRMDISGDEGAEVGLNLIYKFDQKLKQDKKDAGDGHEPNPEP